MPSPVRALLRFAARLRFPVLFALTALLFAIDVLVPDALPFVDELLLGLGTLCLGALREKARRGRGAAE